MKRITLLIIMLALIGWSNRMNAQTVTDIDGNVYNTVTIGTQVWMKENLKVTKYRNGDAIPNVTNDSVWCGLISGAYCNFDNVTANGNIYGHLYNWYAATDSRNIAPTGWHVPTIAEWTTLITYLGGDSEAGGKLKETGTTHWRSSTGATNSSGFTALPGSGRGYCGGFDYLGEDGNWWTSTNAGGNGCNSKCILLLDGGGRVIFNDTKLNSSGLSVRCLKDGGVGIKEDNDNSRFALYPNPSNGKFTITMEDVKGKMADGKLTVYNVLGERVYSATHLQITKSSNYQIDLSALPAGIYFLQVHTGEEFVNRKLVKE